MRPTTYALDATWRPLLKDLAVSPANVLRRAGLPEDLLSRPGCRLGSADFHRFWDAIGAELKDPRLPLRICEAIRSESFSPPLFAALCSPNLVVAAQRISRYKTLVAPVRLDVRENADRVSLRLTWLDPASAPPVSLVTTELLFLVSLARMGTREPIRPLRVSSSTPPERPSDYEAFLGVPIRKGMVHEIIFERADALRPFLTSNESLWAAFEPELRTRLAELDSAVTVAHRVRAVLLEALPAGLSEIKAVANRLAMSPRSLQRKLEEEGTSYREMVRKTREALARHYLGHTKLTSAEISFLIGFGEANSFHRAFLHWTGETPERVRRRNRRGLGRGP